MYELIQVGEKTYYVNCPSKMGIYRFDGSRVCLIDSGNDKDAGKKVFKILTEQGWTLDCIINTHSHADHIGGNALLHQRTGCRIYAPGVDAALAQNTILEPSFIYGGYPPKLLRNKFLLAQPSPAMPLTPDCLPQGLEMLPVDGHSFSMIALKTPDDVWFVADSLSSEAVLHKYPVTFLYDVAAFVDSLERLRSLKGRLFIPSHAEPAEDLGPLISRNLEKVEEICALLIKLCGAPVGFDELLGRVFDHYGMAMNDNQYVLVGSTIRSYLAYLCDRGDLEMLCDRNRMFWRAAQR